MVRDLSIHGNRLSIARLSLIPECPACKGVGAILPPEDEFDPEGVELYTCPSCGGTGRDLPANRFLRENRTAVERFARLRTKHWEDPAAVLGVAIMSVLLAPTSMLACEGGKLDLSLEMWMRRRLIAWRTGAAMAG